MSLAENIYKEENGYILSPYLIKSDEGKKYLTNTECLILNYLLDGNNLLLKDYSQFVFRKKDLPIYIDSINYKLRELGIKVKVIIENDYYKVVNL